MKKVEHVSIGKKAFTVEIEAYANIRTYLQRSEKALTGNPDKDDIMEDLELSLAGHFEKHTTDGSVVDVALAKRVIGTIGEIESDSASDADTPNPPSNSFRDALKHPIYKSHDDEIVAGVCSGVAHAFNVDPLWVRIACIVLTIATSGVAILAYIAAVFLMPEKETYSRKTAQEIVNEGRTELHATVSSGRRKVESTLRSGIRILLKAIRIVASVILLIGLLTIGMAWSTALVFMLTNPERLVLFGGQPSALDFAAIMSVGAAIIVPVFVLIVQLSGAAIARNVRFNIAMWSVWVVALLAGFGSLVNVVPNIQNTLVRDEPKTKHVYVEVSDGKIMHSCITLWGDCFSLHPNIQSIDTCERKIQVVDGTHEEFDRMQQWSWSYEGSLLKTRTDGVSPNYCEYVGSLIDTHGYDQVVFVNDVGLGDPYAAPTPVDIGLAVHMDAPREIDSSDARYSHFIRR